MLQEIYSLICDIRDLILSLRDKELSTSQMNKNIKENRILLGQGLRQDVDRAIDLMVSNNKKSCFIILKFDYSLSLIKEVMRYYEAYYTIELLEKEGSNIIKITRESRK